MYNDCDSKHLKTDEMSQKLTKRCFKCNTDKVRVVLSLSVGPGSEPVQLVLGHLNQQLGVFLQKGRCPVLLQLSGRDSTPPQHRLELGVNDIKRTLQYGRHLKTPIANRRAELGRICIYLYKLIICVQHKWGLYICCNYTVQNKDFLSQLLKKESNLLFLI